MKVKIMVCNKKKKIIYDKWAISVPKMAHPHKSGLAPRIFLKFCRIKVTSRYMKILLVVFREKNSFGAVNWILKQSGHDFFHDYYLILKQSGKMKTGKMTPTFFQLYTLYAKN